MRVLIVGAGQVGRSIARELLAHDHSVLLIDREPTAMRVAQVADADWLLADACELSTLADAHAEECDVLVAATGDDKVNLVVSLLAKTEFGMPRTVARVNNPKNEWIFDESWGVDVAVSTPRIMTAMVEEAVAVGDLVRIFTFHQSGADILEVTLPATSALIGTRVGAIVWPPDTVLAAIVRGTQPIAPSQDDTLEAGDELLLVTGREADEAELQRLFDIEPLAPATTAGAAGWLTVPPFEDPPSYEESADEESADEDGGEVPAAPEEPAAPVPPSSDDGASLANGDLR